MEKNTVRLLGVRGSVPVSGSPFARYGGATTCVLVCLGGQPLLLDAGSGLMNLSGGVPDVPRLPLLLTHAHLDHLLGLPLCPYLMRAQARMEVYAAPRSGLGAREAVGRLLSPPLWPVGPEALPAEIGWHDLPERLTIGGVTVTTAEGRHPGGVTLMRLTAGDKTVVFMTDCTVTEDDLPAMSRFAEGCDLLLCDGQYGDDEWEEKAGFGHSTWTMAARLAASCGAGALRVVHHAPTSTDERLDRAAREIAAIFPNGAPAMEGEEITL